MTDDYQQNITIPLAEYKKLKEAQEILLSITSAYEDAINMLSDDGYVFQIPLDYLKREVGNPTTSSKRKRGKR